MILKNGFRYIFVFLLGAVIYNLIEVIFRGYTHWSMSLAGGSVLLIFYILSDWLAALHPVIGGLTGALVITCVELTVGVIFNILLEKNVWDYSHIPQRSLHSLMLLTKPYSMSTAGHSSILVTRKGYIFVPRSIFLSVAELADEYMLFLYVETIRLCTADASGNEYA